MLYTGETLSVISVRKVYFQLEKPYFGERQIRLDEVEIVEDISQFFSSIKAKTD